MTTCINWGINNRNELYDDSKLQILCYKRRRRILNRSYWATQQLPRLIYVVQPVRKKKRHTKGSQSQQRGEDWLTCLKRRLNHEWSMSNHYCYDMMADNIITTQRCLSIRLFRRKWKTAAVDHNVIKCCTRYTQTVDLSVNDGVSDTTRLFMNYDNIRDCNDRCHSGILEYKQAWNTASMQYKACRTDRRIQLACVKDLRFQ
jgi:hypothetical protein